MGYQNALLLYTNCCCMSKVGVILLSFLLLTELLPAQNTREDSLLSLIPEATSKRRVEIYLKLSSLSISNNPEKSLKFAKNALEISNGLELPLLKAQSLEAWPFHPTERKTRFKLSLKKHIHLVWKAIQYKTTI